MREIKFRAWDKVTKKMLYDFNITSFGEIMQSNGCVNTDDSFILMQYTGLKDKNSKEIYEGDILRMQGNNSLAGPVTYDKSCFDFLEKWIGCMHPVEVIGNIYENPKMLKEEDIEQRDKERRS